MMTLVALGSTIRHSVATGWTAASPNLRSRTGASLNVTNESSTELGDER